MDKQKILDKIKKCMALSKSANAHEAAAALRQAQSLMRKHGITEDEVEALGYGSERVQIPVQANIKLPLYLAYFIDLIKHAFGVEPVMGRSRRLTDVSYDVTYFGPVARVMMASYAHEVCWKAMTRSYNEWLKANPWRRGERGVRTGFYLGWIDEVRGKVEAIGFTEDEKEKTELVIKNQNLKLSATRSAQMNISRSANVAGAASAADFHIHRPIDVSKKRLT